MIPFSYFPLPLSLSGISHSHGIFHSPSNDFLADVTMDGSGLQLYVKHYLIKTYGVRPEFTSWIEYFQVWSVH